MKLGNIKIGTRLTMGFFIVLALMVVIIIVGTYEIKQIDDKLNRIVTVNNAQAELTNVMLDSVYVVSTNIRDMLILEDNSARQKEKEEVDQTRKKYDEAEHNFEKLVNSEEGRVIFNKTKEIKDSARTTNNRIIELAMANNREEAKKILLAEAAPKDTKWLETVRELNNYADGRSKMRFEEAKQSYQSALIYMIAIGGLAIALGLLLALFLTRSITKPVSNLVEVANIAASGDFRSDIVLNSRDEIGKLAEAFKILVTQMRDLIRQIIEKAATVSASSQQLNSSAQQTSAGANENAATMGEISTTVEQVTSNIQVISTSSESATEHANIGRQGIEKITEQMQTIAQSSKEVATVIEGLNKKTQEINQIVVLINNVADQTNLLALNAAIEAARAGEQGRGFAVVAEEVRKLAEQSASATKEISGLINTIQTESKKAVESMAEGGKEVEAGTKVVQEVGENFKEIIKAVQELSSQIQEVASATEQMSAGVQNVAASTEEQTAAMEEVSSSAESLSRLAEELSSLVGRFKV